MCLTFFCHQPNPSIQFLMAFNRDQQIKRQTQPLAPFNQDQNIYAGRDKISGGTWLGVNVKTGIMVALTNYDLEVPRRGKSRGKLVYNFLKTTEYENFHENKYNDCINTQLLKILNQRQEYSAFNLLVYSIKTQSIFYICSELDMKESVILQKNKSYGLCNCAIDVLWPKTKYGLEKFQKVIQSLHTQQSKLRLFDDLQKIMSDRFTFNKDPQQQPAIFIEPYYNQQEQAERMTKSTTFLFISKDQNNNYNLTIKQLTYDSQTLQPTHKLYQKIIITQKK